MRRILIVEDEPSIAEIVEWSVRKGGFRATVVGSLAEARHAIRREPPDLVVLDLGLPDGDGLELCSWVRESRALPIVILTCRDEEFDRVQGLELGADDYVVKPFSPRELLARVRTILRRTEARDDADAPRNLHVGRVSLRPGEHRVTLDDVEVRLTQTEFALLAALLRWPDQVFTRELLSARAYGDDGSVAHRTIDSHVKGIRRKFAAVDPAADPVETVFGVGYRARPIG